MNGSHKKMLDEVLGSMGSSRTGQGADIIKEKDSKVRQAIAELYVVLEGGKNPDLAINLLAEHVAIMVDMINEFKGAR